MEDQLEALRDELRRLGRVVVAFSGGADSAFLAWMAADTLGPDRALAVTAVSPSLAADELADCAALAEEWGLVWRTVVTDELADTRYSANDGLRCYHCKAALMEAVAPLVTAVSAAVEVAAGDPGAAPRSAAPAPAQMGGGSAPAPGAEGDAGPMANPQATVVLGVNLDDLGDHRPGQRAAAERGAAFPLVAAGFTKADVREWSRRLGLRTWDKPAAACLASRVPYGTTVTVSVLSRVERAEAALHRLGFRELRVRHYGDTARLEVPLERLAQVLQHREQVVEAVRRAGYEYVTLDLEGLRSGNLNRALPPF
jgi:pyridinium-3,5-biscarboxylic acid mononucleotide sulfurtransferase